MARGNKFTPELLEEMLSLRQQGWSYPALGKKYGVDHASILYHCQRRNIVITSKLYKKEMSNKYIKSKPKSNFGRSYHSYLTELRIKEKRDKIQRFEEIVKKAKEEMINNRICT